MARSFNIVIGFPSKLRRAVQRHGVVGVLRVAAGQAGELATRLRPSVRAQLLKSERRAQDFDKRFDVDTAGHIHPTELTLKHPNQVHAVSYGASDPEDVTSTIASLPIEYNDFVFVDFGSGKGRAILLASEFPFKRVVGVEFSDELHRVALDNIKRFSKNGCRCLDVESVCMDAIEYRLPEDNLICYFCNPFDATLMTQVAANIRESLLRKPRQIFILYYNAKESHVFDGSDCFERIETTGWIRIWRAVLESNKTKKGSL